MFAEPAIDLAVPMRDWSTELLAGDALSLGRDRCRLLSDLTGVDTQAIWQWGFMERISTGLLLMKVGMKREGADYLKVAELWAGADL